MLQKSFQILVFAVMTLAPAAHANLLQLTVNSCSSGCGSGPYGTISVIQGLDLNTVDITETLAAQEVFAHSGAGDTLGYTTDKTVTLVPGSLTTGFSAGGSDGFGIFGTFAHTIVCTGCGNGTSPPQLSGPVYFSLTNAGGLTPADFIVNGSGYFFAADIGVKNADGVITGTGNVGSIGISTSATPEPGSLILLSAGAALCVCFKKRLNFALTK